MSPTTSSVWTVFPSAATAQRVRRSSARYLAGLRAAMSGETDGEATILALALALARWWRQPDADVLWSAATTAHQLNGNAGPQDAAQLDLREAIAEHESAERELLKDAAAALGIDAHQPRAMDAVRILLFGTARLAMLDGLPRAAGALPAVVDSVRRVVADSSAP